MISALFRRHFVRGSESFLLLKKQQRNKKDKASLAYELLIFPATQARSDPSMVPSKIRARCSRGCKLHKMHQKRDEAWEVLSVLYLGWVYNGSAAFRHSRSVPLSQRGAVLRSRTSEPPLNPAEQCKRKPGKPGQAIFSLKEPEPTESFGKVQNLLTVTLDIKH